ncbi:MAG: DUF4417 domain-containing protein [Bacteroidales bacterium]|nr:DUF4417 domain-containing protein [Bacteroidales bacterium]
MKTENNLFSLKEIYYMEHISNGKAIELCNIPTKRRRKMVYNNMHLLGGMTFTTTNLCCPQLEPYTGATDFVSVSYGERKKHDGKNEALHFFSDDYRFRDAVWCNLEYTTYDISKFDYVYTPDFSLWRDLPTDFYNRESIYRTRFIGAYWQKCGFNVIPTASWGDLASFSYCFDGLPMHSVLAVSGMGNRRNHDAFNRWCYGLRRLEESKAPIQIIVYGEEVDIQGLHTPIKFVPCFIQEKLRRL